MIVSQLFHSNTDQPRKRLHWVNHTVPELVDGLTVGAPVPELGGITGSTPVGVLDPMQLAT